MKRLSWLAGHIVLASFLILAPARSAFGGGPLYVAGASYFDPSVKGHPLVWANGNVFYYTDPGDLSPILPHAAADALVLDAAVHWLLVPNIRLSIRPAGQLAEDVNGTNVTIAGGVLSLPADIQPSAVATPVGIVYDFDGQVTETLLGTNSSLDCLNNAVYGGLDNFNTNATFAHALVILNGLCAQDPSQLFDFEYRLIRVLGHVLGLGSSQANLNVWTGSPAPTAEDFAGFPVMHSFDPPYCLPITNCLPNADQPKMDDRIALARLYPSGAFPNTAIQGRVLFPAAAGGAAAGQGMQGVNVLARRIDPATMQPLKMDVISMVSGNLYHGNAGNPVTGLTDPAGNPYNRWGSDDTAQQGAFYLSGLPIPNGDFSASYEVTVEPVDEVYSETVGSYAPLQVEPSGVSTRVVVFLTNGQVGKQDLVMNGGAFPPADALDRQDYLNPVPAPGGGKWQSWFTAAGGTNYYTITAQANRTLSIEVSTVDDQGNPSQEKAQPVIGIWALADPPGTLPPSATPAAFNTHIPGLTRLDAQVLTSTDFRVGITDCRGDARPDYSHFVRILYADSVTPARAGAQGGDALQIAGMGFQPQMAAQVGGLAASVVDFGANHLVLQTPALPDGVADVLVSDPATLGFTTMQGAVTIGAGPSDTIQLLQVANPASLAIPVGGQTATPLEFLVTAADGTPVAGATVALSTTNRLTLDLCGGATSCSVFSNQSGLVVVNVGAPVAGPGLLTAQLAPASYANPSTAFVTLTGVSGNLDIALLGQLVEVEQGTTVNVPLQARVLSPTGPQAGAGVDFLVVLGQGTPIDSVVITDANGNAQEKLTIAPVTGTVQVVACVDVNNVRGPCKTFTVTPIPADQLQIEAVSGTVQVVTEGQPVAPVVMRVTDSSLPPFPVFGANVTFVNVLSLSSSSSNQPVNVDGGGGSNNFDPVLLGSETTVVPSDSNGLAMIAPWPTPVTAGEEVRGLATVDSGAQTGFFLQVLAAGAGTGGGVRFGGRSVVPRVGRNAARVGWLDGALQGLFGGVFRDVADVGLCSLSGTDKIGLADAKEAVESPAAAPLSTEATQTSDAVKGERKKTACELCSEVPCSVAAAR